MTKKTILTLFTFVALCCNVNGQNTDCYTEGADFTPDMGFQSDYHKANVGKIVFLKTIPDPKDNNPQVSTSFQAGEEIFALAYMQTCVMNYKTFEEGKKKKALKNVRGRILVNVYIDGVKQGSSLRDNNYEDDLASRTFIKFSVYSTNEKFSKDNKTWFVTALNALSSGEHKVRLEIIGVHLATYWTATPIASGEFTYVKTAGSNNAKIGKSFDAVKAGMVDPTLEAEALKYLKEYKPAPGAISFLSPKLKSDKIKILSKDWTILKHPDTGVTTRRCIYVAVECKETSTNECLVRVYGLFQNYAGNGFQKTFSEAGIYSSADFLNASPYYIDCN